MERSMIIGGSSHVAACAAPREHPPATSSLSPTERITASRTHRRIASPPPPRSPQQAQDRGRGTLTYTSLCGFVTRRFYQDLNIRRGRALGIMVHHWRWHGSTRVPRWMRLTVAVSLLLACILLAGIPAAASASTPEMRGEWALTMESSEGTLHGIAHFTQEANPKGEFAAQSMAFETFIEGTFTGTLEGATATVETTSKEFGPVPAGKFKSKTMKVEEGAGTLALSGEGELKLGTKELTAKFTATRIKSGKQIEEQEAREAREREEAEERAAVRGEWTLTLESGPTVLKGTALTTEAANTKSEFAS